MQLASQLAEHRSLIKACCAAGYWIIPIFMGHRRAHCALKSIHLRIHGKSMWSM